MVDYVEVAEGGEVGGFACGGRLAWLFSDTDSILFYPSSFGVKGLGVLKIFLLDITLTPMLI